MTLDRNPVIKAVDGRGRIVGKERGGSWDALDRGVAIDGVSLFYINAKLSSV